MAEAQRLIAVSLGKIAQSRGQRGGASLYKNLLVSTVLQKARHEFMKENFAAMMQARKAQSEKENAKKSEVLEHPPRPQTPAPSVLAVSNPLPKKSEEKLEDKENAPPKVAPIVSEKMVAQECQEDKKELREEKPCAKCTKRRLADVQPQSDSTLCESTSPNKRARHDSESSSDKCDIKSPDVSCHEPMQTEQISNLVNRFNSGLSGLLGSSHNENTKNNCQNDSIVPSCGTQVIFSESLGSRPVIALTV